MTDTERLKSVERELRDLQSRFADLMFTVSELTSSAETRRKSVQSAVDDLQQSIQLIFGNIRIPNVTYKPGRRIPIK